MSNLFYIGLNGYAGSGKDTVAKMLRVILERKDQGYDACKEYYFSTYTNPMQPATFKEYNENSSVMCIAYADQLKIICSAIFGVPIERFYGNKSNAWICITDKFQYTEIPPNSNSIITAEDFYYNDIEDSSEKYWMSLREILVYIGTYVLQKSINKNIFVNIVNNIIEQEAQKNHNLKYIIVTDNRFGHELQYIKDNKGITISIFRDSIKQLDNIAEHDLDNINDYDFVIDNSYSYDNLFDTLWNLVNDNVEFKNETITLSTRENVHNYLRLIDEDEDTRTYKLIYQFPIQNIYHYYDDSSMDIISISLIGGPTITLHDYLDNVEEIELYPIKIDRNETNDYYTITVKKR